MSSRRASLSYQQLRSAGFFCGRPCDMELVMPKFHYIYLAQNLLKTRFPTSFEQKKLGNLVSDKIDLSRHVEIDLAASFRQIKKSGTWSQTSFEQQKSRKPGLRQVVQVVRQDRSNGIWALPDSMRDPAISRDSFRRSLKTFLFSAYLCILRIRAFWTMPSTNLLTYLLT